MGQVSAAVGTDAGLSSLCDARRGRGVLQVGEDHFDGLPCACKDDGLYVLCEQGRRQPDGLQEHAAPQSEGGVDYRRVIDQKVLVALGRTVVVDERNRRLDQPLAQFDGVADRGRGQDELGRRAVKAGHALEPPEDVGDVRAEHAAIGVCFVDHHERQVAEKTGPRGVVGQDAHVEHVGVAQDQAGTLADRRPCRRRGVSVVRGGEDRAALGQVSRKRPERAELVVGQGLGGEQVQRAGLGCLEHPIQDRQVVAQGLAARRGGDHDRVLARAHALPGRCLVRV